MKNSEVINRPNYYDLPCGKQAEDYIWAKRLPFAVGSAYKYRLRAGHKDGESEQKDTGKIGHYVDFLAEHSGIRSTEFWSSAVDEFYRESMSWNGDQTCISPFTMPWTSGK